MPEYIMRPASAEDFRGIAEVYNSNRSFLLNHLGMEQVDEAFAAEDAEAMRAAGFCSCVIQEKNGSKAEGVLDYRPGKEVYLSLLMLTANLQGRGTGRMVYTRFEQEMRLAGSITIRIDVVNDYPGHAVSFWEKLGFTKGECILLNWGKKTSQAVVMRKNIV